MVGPLFWAGVAAAVGVTVGAVGGHVMTKGGAEAASEPVNINIDYGDGFPGNDGEDKKPIDWTKWAIIGIVLVIIFLVIWKYVLHR